MNLKPIALGLAVGVAIDAFVVRMVLVPAVMALLGEHAWYIPRWLDRVLPHFDVEGEGITKELALADWPEPGCTDVVVAHDLVVDGPHGPVVGPVTVRVPDGGALVARGDSAAAVDALLLSLAGRLKSDSGAVKVAGFVLPERSGAVRGRVAVVDAAPPATRREDARESRHDDAAAGVRDAVRRKARAVVVLHGEALGDRDARDALAAALASAHEKGTAVLVGTTGAGAPDLLPGAPTLDVSAPPVEPVATTPPDDTEVVSTSSTTGAGSVDDTEVSL